MADFHYERHGTNNDITSLVLSGELDAFNCDYVLKCVESLVQDGCTKLVLDCTELTFISSVGIGMLMRVHSRMKRIGGDVNVAGVQGTVANIVRLVRLDKALHMFDTVDDAVEALGG